MKEWLKEVSHYFRHKKSVVSGWWGTEEGLVEVDGFEGWGLLQSARPSGQVDRYWVEPSRLLKFSSSTAATQYALVCKAEASGELMGDGEEGD